MIYKEVFDLRGTEQQQQIVKDALDAIKFPFERIKFPKGVAIMGWAKLNGQALETEAPIQEVKFIPDEPPQILQTAEVPRGHEGDHPAKDTDTEALTGEVNGRKYTLGVFYPSTGNIYLDVALVNHPHLARTTVSAEVAHGVDEFLPMTEDQRNQIILLLHGGQLSTEHTDTWWEVSDYGAEYYNLIGEHFMPLFTYAYSDMPFDGVESFTHKMDKEMADEVRAILGIERTDYVPPVEPVAIPEPVLEPEVIPEPTPVEETPPQPVIEEPIPTVEHTHYVRYGKSKVYHVPDHYEKKKNGTELHEADLVSLKACRVCIDKKKKV